MLKVFGKGCGGEPFLRKVSPTKGACVYKFPGRGYFFMQVLIECINGVEL